MPFFGNTRSSRASVNMNSINNRKQGPTNEVEKFVNGIKHKRLGGGDIVVSELG